MAVASFAVLYLRARSWGLPAALVMMAAIGAARWAALGRAAGQSRSLWATGGVPPAAGCIAGSIGLHPATAHSTPATAERLLQSTYAALIVVAGSVHSHWADLANIPHHCAPQGREGSEHPVAWQLGLPDRPGCL